MPFNLKNEKNHLKNDKKWSCIAGFITNRFSDKGQNKGNFCFSFENVSSTYNSRNLRGKAFLKTNSGKFLLKYSY